MTGPEILVAGRRSDIERAAGILREGGIVIIPTDTLYGLAATMSQEAAIDRVFEAKRRPAELRLPLLMATPDWLPTVARSVSEDVQRLVSRFWPGPLTIVVAAGSNVPGAITAGGNTVAVRVPASRSCREVIRLVGEPIVGTSANVSGKPPAATAAEALGQLGDSIDAILQDDEAIETGVASTVIDLSTPQPIIRRPGAVSVDQLRMVLGKNIS